MKNVKKIFEVKCILWTVLFGIVNAIACWIFVVPNDFASSGVEGVGVIVQHVTGFSVSWFQLIVNVPLCVFAFFCVDKRFAVNSIMYSLVYYMVYSLCRDIQLEQFKYFSYGIDTIYPVIIDGVVNGVAYGILFKQYSSTGGVDIISRYINKVKPQYNFFYVTFAINATIAIVSCFVFKQEYNGQLYYSYKPACMCLLCDFISNMIGDKIMHGYDSAYEYFIVSDKIEEIEKRISELTGHTSTRFDCYGSYSNTDKKSLVCVINKSDVADIDLMLKDYPDSFVSIKPVEKVIGCFAKKHIVK